jgi:hypothetical protein
MYFYNNDEKTGMILILWIVWKHTSNTFYIKFCQSDISNKSTQLTLISNLKEIIYIFDLVVSAIGIVGCGKKKKKFPSRE